MESSASRIFDQAENRLHAQQALLATLLGAEGRQTVFQWHKCISAVAHAPAMPLEALTAAQQELYDWLAEFIADNRHSPSIRQMMQGMGLRSPAPIKAACAICSRRAGSPGKRSSPHPATAG